jgi:alginate O-acetyltransferase complex protein AlgI
MNFISSIFFLFITIVVIIYYAVPQKWQWIILLIASYVFYLAGNTYLVVYLLFTTGVIFYAGIRIGNVNQDYQVKLAEINSSGNITGKRDLQNSTKKTNNAILVSALLINFGILAVLKYSGMFVSSSAQFLTLLFPDYVAPTISWILPLGISFYTFQACGYLIDIYRGKIQPERNLAKFALFVSFFPQMVQGPISRYDELAQQLFVSRGFNLEWIQNGLQLFFWGLFKKLVIADRIAVVVNTVFDHQEKYSGLILLLGAFMYCVQIYCDFSGGIDIARAVAEMLGIHLTNNFARPFFADSIENFWRRWHITLSSWTRDYIFYPLSLSKSFAKLGKSSRKLFGNNVGKRIPTLLAMLITFLVIGIWHGPNWKFVAYGLYNGGLIITGMVLEQPARKLISKLSIPTNVFSWKLFQIAGTLFLVVIGRFFSRAADLYTALRMIKRSFTGFDLSIFLQKPIDLGLSVNEIQVVVIALAILFIVELLQEKGFKIRQELAKQVLVFRWAIYFALIFSVIIFGVYGLAYNETSFIYKGF